jgi:chromosome segregation ATPase
MANTTAISLAKALKVKNRLAGRLSQVTTTIKLYNSTVKGRAGEVNVAQLDIERKQLVDALVALKAAIYENNRGIYRYLAELEEKKGEIEFLKNLITRHGTEPGYQGQMFEYVAVIKKTDVDKRIKQLERDIDALQDMIDAYNASSDRLSVDARILELAS